MVFFKIFEHPETRRYRTQLVTKVTVFYVISTAIQVFCPLLVAYRSYGKWCSFRQIFIFKIFISYSFIVILDCLSQTLKNIEGCPSGYLYST